MKARILEVRRNLHLSQQAFGDRLGISGAAISRIESGNREPSEAVIRAICREFRVRSQYLREGVGPMFVKPVDDIDLVNQVMTGQNEYAKRLLVAIVKAGEKGQGWEVLRETLDALTKTEL